MDEDYGYFSDGSDIEDAVGICREIVDHRRQTDAFDAYFDIKQYIGEIKVPLCQYISPLEIEHFYEQSSSKLLKEEIIVPRQWINIYKRELRTIFNTLGSRLSGNHLKPSNVIRFVWCMSDGGQIPWWKLN